MLNMIIADDEKLIRESLTEYVDWSSLNIRITACCRNGVEALNAILDTAPDIVMTDIKMPGLSGLELIERIHGLDREVEFIILSGFREFEFAKAAMAFGVRRYLLKPVVKEQLLEAVEDARNHCLSRRRSTSSAVQAPKELIQKLDSFYRRQFLYDCFSSGSTPSRILETYSSHFPRTRYTLFYFSFLQENVLTDFASRLYKVLEALGISPAADLLYVRNSGVLIASGVNTEQRRKLLDWGSGLCLSGQTVSLNSKAEDYADFQECLQHLQKSLFRYPRIQAIDSGSGLWELYNSALSLERLHQLVHELMESSPEDASGRLELFLSGIEDISLLRAYGANLISRIGLASSPRFAPSMKGIFDEIYLEEHPGQIRIKIKEQLMNLLFSRERRENRSVVQKVKEYIHLHLSDSNISLKQIANEHIHMNVDYLGRLFYQETDFQKVYGNNPKHLDGKPAYGELNRMVYLSGGIKGLALSLKSSLR